MAILNFKEIPQANKGGGEQDRFELFARDFFEYLGYKIISDPSRGADGGLDLLIEEKRVGVGGETILEWLVSCKHHAHSGKSVTQKDDANIRDRLERNKCQGFIGFYSTIPSSGLLGTLIGMKGKIDFQIFDNEKIQKKLLSSSEGIEIAERYFPESIKNWRIENPKPVKIFGEDPTLKCDYCGKNLLDSESNGIIVIWEKSKANESHEIDNIYWCCKGYCDDVLKNRYSESDNIDKWEDIPDIIILTIYIKWVMTIFNELYMGKKYSENAFDKIKEFMLNIFPYISRHLTSIEEERFKNLIRIPFY